MYNECRLKLCVTSVICRYVQLPVNAAMAEAWMEPWQPVSSSHEATPTLRTFMEAAGLLRVGVFGSGPLQEAALLQQPALQVGALQQLFPFASVLVDWLHASAPLYRSDPLHQNNASPSHKQLMLVVHTFLTQSLHRVVMCFVLAQTGQMLCMLSLAAVTDHSRGHEHKAWTLCTQFGRLGAVFPLWTGLISLSLSYIHLAETDPVNSFQHFSIEGCCRTMVEPNGQ